MNCKISAKTLPITRAVLNRIIEIDKTFYKNFDYSNTSWYFNRYSPKNMATLLFVDNQIVGYYCFYTISDNLFNDILNLKYSGDYDFPVNEINVSSKNHYIASILVLEEYKKYSLPLLLALKKEIPLKERLVSIAISEEGKRLCNLFMEKKGSPAKNSEVYYYSKL